MDALDKLEFRLSEPGLRRFDQNRPRTSLPTLDSAFSHLASGRRRSHRRFAHGRIELSVFGGLLQCLTQRRIANEPFAKYWYASAGNLYPVRTYVYIKPARVASLQGGYYYHDPVAHALVGLPDTTPLENQRFGQNQPIFSDAAFALLLVARSGAIEPVYGTAATRFVWIEAGSIAQLLELRAAELSIGLCQIGDADYSELATRLLLLSDEAIVHVLCGGLSLDVSLRPDSTTRSA